MATVHETKEKYNTISVVYEILLYILLLGIGI